MKKRLFDAFAIEHIYQRPAGRGVLFYSDVDFIQFVTIVSVFAKKHGITIVGICIMPDHFHLLTIADSLKESYSFIQDSTAWHASDFNKYCGWKGRLWTKSYGKALKVGDKVKRTAIAYVNNNGVERHLSLKSEEYRWNLLSYYASDHPFSEPLVRNTASSYLKKAQAIVRRYHDRNLPLDIYLLEKQKESLSEKEWKQLSDYILVLYNVIDYQSAIRYYGSFETMLLAINSNTGSEYELREERNSYSDKAYDDITDYLRKTGRFHGASQNPRTILRLSISERMLLADEMIDKRIGPSYQILKYLHLLRKPK